MINNTPEQYSQDNMVGDTIRINPDIVTLSIASTQRPEPQRKT